MAFGGWMPKNRRTFVRFALIVSGLTATTLLGLGIGELAPSGGVATLCDLAGIASAMTFLALSDGA